MTRQQFISFSGIVLTVIGGIFSLMFLASVQFELNPTVWFSASYYLQFIPLYIASTLLISGIFISAKFSKVNVYLAVFGHATSEEILFHILGLATSPLPLYAMYIFLPISLVALWVAYFNVLEKKSISVTEALFGFIFSTAFILLPRYY
ncbi:hypothetical protein QX776_09745 [Alteromonadaceae bacterium BrNp21-10]|nr:hypothetical protein [Alteromonadaceae bacterium BrNp21-10]